MIEEQKIEADVYNNPWTILDKPAQVVSPYRVEVAKTRDVLDIQ